MKRTLNLKGRLVEWDRPVIMGVLNLTEDSFHAASRVNLDGIAAKAREMLSAGCDILDIGACSTRPGSEPVDEHREMELLTEGVHRVRSLQDPDGDHSIVISADTFRASVAEAAVEAGADIINDVSGGEGDPRMLHAVAAMKVPYVLTHTRGTPATMQSLADYDDVVSETLRELAFKIDRFRQEGVADLIVDPGFGFAKTLDQNYALLASLSAFRELGCSLLAGLSRKSMICKELGIDAEEALNGTTALNMAALINGADILRVHDVKEAVQTARLFMALKRNESPKLRIITTTDYPQ